MWAPAHHGHLTPTSVKHRHYFFSSTFPEFVSPWSSLCSFLSLNLCEELCTWLIYKQVLRNVMTELETDSQRACTEKLANSKEATEFERPVNIHSHTHWKLFRGRLALWLGQMPNDFILKKRTIPFRYQHQLILVWPGLKSLQQDLPFFLLQRKFSLWNTHEVIVDNGPWSGSYKFCHLAEKCIPYLLLQDLIMCCTGELIMKSLKKCLIAKKFLS